MLLHAIHIVSRNEIYNQRRAYDIHSSTDTSHKHELLLCQCNTPSLGLSRLDPLSNLGLVTGLDGGDGDTWGE